MDLRTRTSLFCGVLALAIAVSILLRGRPRRMQLYFAAFAADIGLWYLAQWLYLFVRADVWARFTAVLAVILPQLALQLFDAIVPEPPSRRSQLIRVAGWFVLPMIGGALLLPEGSVLFRTAVFAYVFGLLLAGFWSLALRGEKSRSRAIQRRVRFLVLIGAGAATFTLADFLWFLGAPLPPIGAVLSIVFLFVLSESMTRQRLVDLYDILGQLLVSTALAFVLAGIFYVFVVLFGGFDTMYLGAILAAIVILVLLEPLHQIVEQYMHLFFFRERGDLEKAVGRARSQLLHVLAVDVMAQTVLSVLEGSHRATGVALYLRDPVHESFELAASYGPAAPQRIDFATARPLMDRVAHAGTISLEQVAAEVVERRRNREREPGDADERVLTAAAVLGPFRHAIIVGVRGDGRELYGLLLVADDRVRDAFSPDEVAILESLAPPMAVVIENSRAYRRLQERDRLAVLGQMAAGLAHEVKNPLGAIKGAAQLLADPAVELDAASREFVGIILEEVDRLDRVVGSVLSYARPSEGTFAAVDVNAIVRRTVQVLEADRQECTLELELTDDLPEARLDAEQLRQVLINLVKNAVQAMSGKGRVLVGTRQRKIRRPEPGAEPELWIEVLVRDEGPGIGYQMQKSLFVPFFTTKESGTGLGLAISQRLVEGMGGRIEVQSRPGAGATFTIVLPTRGAPRADGRAQEPSFSGIRTPSMPPVARGGGTAGHGGSSAALPAAGTEPIPPQSGVSALDSGGAVRSGSGAQADHGTLASDRVVANGSRA